MTAEWIPGDWSTLTPGTTVRLEHGDGSILMGTVINDTGCSGGCGDNLVRTPLATKNGESWAGSGWSLFVPAPTTPELPSKSSTVVGYDAGGFRLIPALRTGIDGWQVAGVDGYLSNQAFIKHLSGRPFRILEPRAETAEEFISALTKKCPKEGNTYQVHASDLIELANEFEVRPV